MRKRYKDYVCPTCFSTLPKCKCELRPYFLIMIDNGIQEHIKLLNTKGYKTTGSCESHEKICNNIYISFNKDYGFNTNISLPNDFKFIKNKYAITFEFPKHLTKEEKNELKTIKLNELLKWCNELPSLTESLLED